MYLSIINVTRYLVIVFCSITVKFTVNNSISSSEEDLEEEPSDEMDTAIPQVLSSSHALLSLNACAE